MRPHLVIELMSRIICRHTLSHHARSSTRPRTRTNHGHLHMESVHAQHKQVFCDCTAISTLYGSKNSDRGSPGSRVCISSVPLSGGFEPHSSKGIAIGKRKQSLLVCSSLHQHTNTNCTVMYTHVAACFNVTPQARMGCKGP